MIQKLNDLISRIPSYKNKNLDETNTKQVIILPLLNFLGWDTYNPEEVKAEFLVPGGKVDYSLRIHNSNKVFMEVKRVGTELENHQNQLLNYSFKHGVKLAILTNGITWWFYLPLTEGSWEQRKFYAIDMLQQEVIDITDKFESFLSRSNVESGESVEIADKLFKGKQKEKTIKENLPKAWKRIIISQDKLLVDLLAETTEKICGYRPDVEHVEFFLKSIEMYNKPEHVAAIKQVQQFSQPVTPRINSETAKSNSHSAYQSEYWYVNVGETSVHARNWEDNMRYGYIGAGCGPKWTTRLKKLKPGDKIFAYLGGRKGYVGYGVVVESACMVKDFFVDSEGKRLLELKLTAPNVSHDQDDPEKCEWAVKVDWKKTFHREQAKKFEKSKGCFSHQRSVLSLNKQPKTVNFLREQFEIGE